MTDMPEIHKGAYPFRLACPSFIYPAGYTDNVRRLGPVVDEIELLLFESGPGALPDNDEINELKRLGRTCDITYNVHLPTDVAISHPDRSEQEAAIDALKSAIDRSLPLAPSSFTLHIPYTEPDTRPEQQRQWRKRVRAGAAGLLAGLPAGPRAIAVETLHYPFEFLEGIIEEFDFSVCVDTGHIMACNHLCSPLYDQYRDRIPIIHIHGLLEERDHISLSHLTAPQAADLCHILCRIQTTVSLEVFSVDHLAASLDYLHSLWHNA